MHGMTLGSSFGGVWTARAAGTALNADALGQWDVLGWVDPQTFGLSVHLIIGAVVVGLLATVLVLAAWVLLRVLTWRAEVRRAQKHAARARLRDNGQPYPPADRGLCDVCARAFEKVYYLPSGQRMCEDCYRQMVQQAHEQAFCAPPGTGQGGLEDRPDDQRRIAHDVVPPEGDGRQGL